MSVEFRNNVQIRGRGERAMMFAHGFGCDQNMWRFVAPAFEADFATVLFDHVGAGHSDLTAYDRGKYSTLSGYADDVVEIGRSLRLKDAVFVGHSVSAMIGVLAAIKDPTLFESVVLVGPSARYIARRRLCRRVQRSPDRGASFLSGREPHGLVGADGARHHGQPGPSRTGRGTYE